MSREPDPTAARAAQAFHLWQQARERARLETQEGTVYPDNDHGTYGYRRIARMDIEE